MLIKYTIGIVLTVISIQPSVASRMRSSADTQGEILREIDGDLGHATVADDLADAGFGKRSGSSAADVLNRLKAEK